MTLAVDAVTYRRAMGIRQQGVIRDDDERVVITDLGVVSTQAGSGPNPPIPGPAPSTRTWRALLTCASVAGLLLIATDTVVQHDEATSNTAGFADSCEEIQKVSQQAAPPTDFLSGTAVPAEPLVMSLSQVDPSTGHEVAIAQVNADGLWIFCATPAELAGLGEPAYPGEETLGELPEGMAYVYRQDNAKTAYSVVGVRLRNGSIVDHIDLQDGRTLPEMPPAPRLRRPSGTM